MMIFSRYILAVLPILSLVSAEVVRVEKREVPPPLSLEAVQLIYAFSEEQTSSQSTVTFDDFRVVRKQDRPPAMSDRASKAFSILLIPWEDFDDLTDPLWLCEMKATGGELMLKDIPQKDFVVQVTLEVGATHTFEAPVKKHGVYALCYSNCGSDVDYTLSGSVKVKNAHGYLGGHERHKIAVYTFFVAVMSVLAIAWLVTVLIRRDFQHMVHHGISMLIGVALVNSIAWLTLYAVLNRRGEADTAARLSEALSALKMMYTTSVVLSVALGLGVTTVKFEASTEWKVLVGSGFAGVAFVPAIGVLQQRQAVRIPTKMLVAESMPFCVMILFLSCWMFRSLAHTMRRCNDLGQVDGLKRFQRTTILFALLGVVFLVIFVLQLAHDSLQGRPQNIFITDVAGDLLYCVGLVLFVWMWAPGEFGYLLDNYSAPKDQVESKTEEGTMFTVARDDAGDDEHDILADCVEEKEHIKPGATKFGAAVE